MVYYICKIKKRNESSENLGGDQRQKGKNFMTKREMLESIVDGTILNENKREEAAAIAAIFSRVSS